MSLTSAVVCPAALGVPCKQVIFFPILNAKYCYAYLPTSAPHHPFCVFTSAGTNDMREQNVFETVMGKKQQLFLATQVGAS